MPLVSRTNELAPSAPTSHLRADRAALAGARQLPRLLLDHPADRQLDMVARVVEPLGHPAPLDGHARRDAGVAVDRRLELGLEEHVVRLPPRSRQAVHVEPQQQLAVGAEPLVVADRHHLPGQHVGEPERLQQAHDLVIEVNRAG